MTLGVIMEVQTKDGNATAFEHLLASILPDTRRYPGCVSIQILRDLDNLSQYAFIEQWANRQAYDAYLAWRKETGVLDQLGLMFAVPPKLRFFDVTPC